jgi:hypothetical protein
MTDTWEDRLSGCGCVAVLFGSVALLALLLA